MDLGSPCWVCPFVFNELPRISCSFLYLFSFVILSRLSARYFIRVYFLCASSFWKSRFNFVWQLGPTAQPLAALQTLSAHQRGCGEGKLSLSWDNALTQKNILWVTCNPLSPFVLSSYVLSSSISSLPTCPVKHWWDIFFHLLLHLLSDWPRLSP